MDVTRRRGKIHPGVSFFEIHVPFTSGWKLKISTPRWNEYFDLSAWHSKCFHFIKIQIFWYVITDKRQVISDKSEKKKNRYTYVLIDSSQASVASLLLLLWSPLFLFRNLTSWTWISLLKSLIYKKLTLTLIWVGFLGTRFELGGGREVKLPRV